MTRHKKIKLYDVLHASYQNNKEAKDALTKHGYILDEELSKGYEKVYYNPDDKKLIFSVAGSSSVDDWVNTDPLLALGGLKYTDRYEEAHQRLIDSKKKYGVNNATVVGHSLGGGIASGIGSASDRIFTYNKGITLFGKNRDNETHYRTRGDIVSTFAPNDQHNVILHNKHNSNVLNSAGDFGKAHNVDNLLDEEGIYI